MADLFMRLARRALEPATAVRPVTPPVFGPPPAVHEGDVRAAPVARPGSGGEVEAASGERATVRPEAPRGMVPAQSFPGDPPARAGAPPTDTMALGRHPAAAAPEPAARPARPRAGREARPSSAAPPPSPPAPAHSFGRTPVARDAPDALPAASRGRPDPASSLPAVRSSSLRPERGDAMTAVRPLAPVSRPRTLPTRSADSLRPEPSAPPTIRVTIGRVEVRAPSVPPAPVQTPPREPQLSLEDYLESRRGGRG